MLPTDMIPVLARPSGPRLHRGGVYICFMLLAVASTVLAIPPLLFATPAAPGVPLLLAVVVSAALIAVVWWALSRLRIYRGTTRRLAGMALWWGATASGVLAALTAAEPASEIPQKLGWPLLATAFGGAWPEEITKALGIWMLLWIGRDWWHQPRHGLIAGAFVGLGMGVYEDSLYALFLGVTHPSSDVVGMLSAYSLRLIFGLGLHMVFSGIVGYGIGRALWGQENRGRGWRFGQVFGWGFVGFGLHFLWNVSWPPSVALLAMVLIWIAGAALFVWLILREERALAQLDRRFQEPGHELIWD